MHIDPHITPDKLLPALKRVFQHAAEKTIALDREWNHARGAPVCTVNGKYTTRGWTDWTQGFQFGLAILAFDATDDQKLLELGRQRTLQHMATHITHTGVHDHAFNNLSTYGNLRRLMLEKRFPFNPWEMNFYELAIKASGAVQAARWTQTDNDGGFIRSFNGPHSLFIDTMRTLRILSLAHQLGHTLMGEQDQKINLLGRAITHALTTSKYIICHGSTEQPYDIPGRTAHEGVFNITNGQFRCRSTQQGYSPFSTWTRGLAWAMLGYAEQLEFLKTLPPAQIKSATGLDKTHVIQQFTHAAKITCDHYIHHCSTTDGITYWDDDAPNLHKLGNWRDKPAEPFNDHEPVDASASAIAAQGLIRLGQTLGQRQGKTYTQAGLTVARTLCDQPYLATSAKHQGLLLHSIYHRPNGWDHTPKNRKIPCSESSMWGDYHLLELANLIKRIAKREPCPAFFDHP